MTWQVELTPNAESNLRSIFHWIAERSPDGAIRWNQAAKKALYSIESNPFACGFARENRHPKFEIRDKGFRTRRGSTYRIVFFIEENIVYVTHIRGPRQKTIPKSELP